MTKGLQASPALAQLTQRKPEDWKPWSDEVGPIERRQSMPHILIDSVAPVAGEQPPGSCPLSSATNAPGMSSKEEP